MNKTMKIILIVCVIVLVLAISGSMIYYFAFAKPANERANLEWEKEKLRKEEEQREEEKQQEVFEESVRRSALFECLDNAYKTYIQQWNEQCEELGKPDDCELPKITADWLNEYYDKACDDCYKLYGSD